MLCRSRAILNIVCMKDMNPPKYVHILTKYRRAIVPRKAVCSILCIVLSLTILLVDRRCLWQVSLLANQNRGVTLTPHFSRVAQNPVRRISDLHGQRDKLVDR